MNLLQPVKGELNYDGCISQMFNDKYTPADLLAFYQLLGLTGHNGIDFSGPRGTNIYAAHDGIVTYAQDCGNTGGKRIKIEKDDFYTVYLHNDQLLVSVGENVVQGQIIAKMGNSGSTPQFYMGVHCHFGLYFVNPDKSIKNYYNGFFGAVDPMPYFTSMEYIIIGKEQYLLYAPLKMALNIGDQNILAGLVLNGLAGQPTVKTSLPAGYKVYPLVDKETLKDIFGL